jgi:hypothetical protein
MLACTAFEDAPNIFYKFTVPKMKVTFSLKLMLGNLYFPSSKNVSFQNEIEIVVYSGLSKSRGWKAYENAFFFI